MKKRNFFPIILLLLLCTLLSSAASALEAPTHEAAAVLLMEENSGQVLYEYHADDRIYPASTTKIMTALLAIEAVESGQAALTDTVVASSTAMEGLSLDGSTANIQVGEVMSYENLLSCMMVSSANEACNILAEYIDGSVEAFVARMNQRAQELGCTGTQFTNTNGLPDEVHYTTARDLYLITKQALSYPLFVKISNTVTTTIPKTNRSDVRILETSNELIAPGSRNYYEAAAGVKTGYTSAAGSCLVSTAANEEMQLVSIVMGIGAETEATSFSTARAIYEWAFDSFSMQEVLRETELITQVSVSLGLDADSVVLKPQSTLSLLLPNDVEQADFLREIVIYSEEAGEALTAPINTGAELGEIVVSYNGVPYGPIKLVANSSVDLSRTEYLKSEIAATLNKVWVRVAIIFFALLLILYVVFVIKYNLNREKRQKSKIK